MRDAQSSVISDGVANVFFGHPDDPCRLRNLLEARIDAVPAGGEILWITYYFRDERLADALIRAHRRGVDLSIAVEGAPRLRRANETVIAKLSDPDRGIGRRLRVVHRGFFRHLHEKLYCFSHPQPVVLVGSFNPSGNLPEDPAIVRKIGDQNRGHNVLVELRGTIVDQLAGHARALHDHPAFAFQRFSRKWRQPLQGHCVKAFLFPRIGNPLDALLRDVPSGSRLRVAASHLRDGSVASALGILAKSGVQVDLLTEATTRRVPQRIERQLRASGVSFTRYKHPDNLPMHSKFIVADTPHGRWVSFGSFNLTRTSRWLNTELLAVCKDDHVVAVFAERWDMMHVEMSRRGHSPS